jgi:hypothetical protein
LAWSSDGRLIYSSLEPRPRQLDSNLWSVALDRQSKPILPGVRLTNDPGTVLSLSASADSRRIVSISGWPGLSSLDWAADSKALWATSVREEENALLHIDLEGHARQVWRPRKMTIGWAIPSRDGRNLALLVSRGSANVWMAERP